MKTTWNPYSEGKSGEKKGEKEGGEIVYIVEGADSSLPFSVPRSGQGGVFHWENLGKGKRMGTKAYSPIAFGTIF